MKISFCSYLVLMAFSFTDMVYATCPTPTEMKRSFVTAAKEASSQSKEQLDANFRSYYGDPQGKSYVRKYFMLMIPHFLHNVDVSNFSFTKNFDDLVKNMTNEQRDSVTVQKAQTEKTSDCHYYVNVNGTDFLLLSFRVTEK